MIYRSRAQGKGAWLKSMLQGFLLTTYHCYREIHFSARLEATPDLNFSIVDGP